MRPLLRSLQLPRITPLTHSRRALSTLIEGERYWKDTPWKDVSAEEFTSYRWQVSDSCQPFIDGGILQLELDHVSNILRFVIQ